MCVRTYIVHVSSTFVSMAGGQALLCLWSNFAGEGTRIGSKTLLPQASMTFLGVMLERERLGSVRHRSSEACEEFRAIKPCLTTRGLSLKVRLKQLGATISPVLDWGAPVWHLWKDSLSTAEGAIICMARITMHDCCSTNEGRLHWHLRGWRSAREHLAAPWGCRPVVIIAACAVSAGRRTDPLAEWWVEF